MFIRQDGPHLRVLAPAKLNLFLEVLAKRPDGFHEIETLMVAVSLFDTLTFELRDAGDIELHVDAGLSDAPGMPVDVRENLVYRALRLLQTRSGCEHGGVARLTKRIPPASGLGGGSSDAAAALLAANIAWGLQWDREKLSEVAAELGSDIPFFLTRPSGASAIAATCRGRGEIVEPAAAPANLHFVIARPDVGLSTAEIYRRSQAAAHPRSASALLTALRAGDLRSAPSLMINRLQAPALETAPVLVELAEQFASLGPIAHQLSGSGSAYFGWFAQAKTARRAAATLRGRGWPRTWYAQAI